MCSNCWIDNGSSKIYNEEVEKAADLIDELYECEDGGVGGYAHIVTDDWNLEDHSIDWCIEAAEKGEYKHLNEECRQASLKALQQLRKLSEEERYSALALSSGFYEPGKSN